jgi:hypothetical protein
VRFVRRRRDNGDILIKSLKNLSANGFSRAASVGGKKLSRNESLANMTHCQLRRLVRYAKKRGKKSLTGVGMAGMAGMGGHGTCKISPDQIRATEVLLYLSTVK